MQRIPYTLPRFTCSLLYQFTQVAITKYHKLRGLEEQKFIFSQFQKLEFQNRGVGKVVSFLRHQGRILPCLFLVFWWLLAFLGFPWLVATWATVCLLFTWLSSLSLSDSDSDSVSPPCPLLSLCLQISLSYKVTQIQYNLILT